MKINFKLFPAVLILIFCSQSLADWTAYNSCLVGLVGFCEGWGPGWSGRQVASVDFYNRNVVSLYCTSDPNSDFLGVYIRSCYAPDAMIPGGSLQGNSEEQSCRRGSIIDVDSLSIGETIDIPGSNSQLVHFSDRTNSVLANDTFRIPLTSETLNPEVTKIDVLGTVAGVSFGRSFTTFTPNQYWDYRLPATDDHNNPLDGSTPIFVTIYERHGTTTQIRQIQGTVGSASNKKLGLGGWGLSTVHRLSLTGEIAWGFGGTAKANLIARPDTTYAVAVPNSDEIYIFNNTLQHIETRTFLKGVVVQRNEYTASGQIDYVYDRYNNYLHVVRDSAENPTSIVTSWGTSVALGLDSAGRIETVTDELNNSHTVTYKAGTDLISSFRKPNGEVSYMNYNALGKLTRDRGRDGNAQNFVQDLISVTRPITLTTALGRTTTFNFKENGSSFQRTEILPNGKQINYTRDPNSKSIIDGQLQTSESYINDPRLGDKLRIPNGRNAFGNGLSVVREFSNTYNMDPAGDPVFGVNSHIFVEKINGQVWSTAYTDNTKTYTKTSPEGRVAKALVNANEDVVSSQVGSLAPVQLTYLSNGNLQNISQGDRQTSLGYDTRGRVISITDPLGRITQFEYDLIGNRTATILPDNRRTEFGYDEIGQLISVKPAGKRIQRYKYNFMGLLSSYNPVNLSSVLTTDQTLWNYNLDKQLTSIVRPDGQIKSLVYDNVSGRLTQIAQPDRTFYISAVDTQSNKPTQIYDLSDFLTRSYNVSGDIVQETIATPGAQSRLLLTRDSLLRTTTVWFDTLAGQRSFDLSYSPDGNLLTAGSEFLFYDTNGLLSQAKLQNYTTNFEYNEFGELATQSNNFGAVESHRLQLTRDALGRVSRKIETTGGVATNWRYSYNLAGRMSASRKNLDEVVHYYYDANGNRTKTVQGTSTLLATYDTQDRLVQWGSNVCSYNVNGELIQKANTVATATTTYDYTVDGILKNVVLPSGKEISYRIDFLGRRLYKKVNGVVVEYYVYQDEKLLAVLSPTGEFRSYYIYGSQSSSPDYAVISGVTYHLVKDHLGSIRSVVNADTGVVAQEIQYDPWGAIVSDSSPGFQALGFAGGLYDQDTQLVHFGARDYDAETGRWTSKDPILFRGGDTNLFGYVANDPINFIDPRGLWSISVSLFAGYGGAVTIGQNPNGGYFGSVRAGVGIGAGASWDPHGASPDGGSCKGISTGQYAEGSAHFGPLEAVLNTNSGYSQTKGPYFNRPQFSGSVVPSIGVGAGVSGGFELTYQ